jgi:hypothetical protein
MNGVHQCSLILRLAWPSQVLAGMLQRPREWLSVCFYAIVHVVWLKSVDAMHARWDGSAIAHWRATWCFTNWEGLS